VNPEIRQEDPLYAFACVAMLEFARVYILMHVIPRRSKSSKGMHPLNGLLLRLKIRRGDDEADWWKSV
jgi:hypothetical protein